MVAVLDGSWQKQKTAHFSHDTGDLRALLTRYARWIPPLQVDSLSLKM
jgi:hypothetical protein